MRAVYHHILTGITCVAGSYAVSGVENVTMRSSVGVSVSSLFLLNVVVYFMPFIRKKGFFILGWLLALFLILPCFMVANSIEYYLLCVAFTNIPDIDTKLFSKKANHRYSLFHSIAFWSILHVVFVFYYSLLSAITLGAIIHLLWDMLTPNGVNIRPLRRGKIP